MGGKGEIFSHKYSRRGANSIEMSNLFVYDLPSSKSSVPSLCKLCMLAESLVFDRNTKEKLLSKARHHLPFSALSLANYIHTLMLFQDIHYSLIREISWFFRKPKTVREGFKNYVCTFCKKFYKGRTPPPPPPVCRKLVRFSKKP